MRKSKNKKGKKYDFRRIIVVCLSFFVIFSTVAYFYNQNFSADASPQVEPNTKIAFIGDSYYGDDFKAVLQMIKNEDTDIVMHQGDFDYEDNPVGFFTVIADADLDKDGKTRNTDGSLDLDYPYFITEGNHDWDSWPSTCTNPNGCYANYLKQIFQNLGITPDDPDLDDQNYAITYRGIKMVSTGEFLDWAPIAEFADQQLKKDPVLWQVCSQHKTQHILQVGEKPDETGWDLLENCRKEGAIIASAHEHSYSRTKTLVNMPNLTVDPSCSNPNEICLDKGKTFSFISGIGGADVRLQKRCLPTTYPYGCNGEWASIYTNDHPLVPEQIPWNTPGALFININVDGNERKAEGYMKLTTGHVLDNFTITNTKQMATPTPTITKVNLGITADTFVTSGNKATNFSTSTSIKINSSPKKIAYLRLNLSSLANKNIKMANLKINVANPSTGTLNFKNTSNTWNNSTINFNNKPALGTKFASAKITEVGVKYINITNFVNTNKGKTVSFAIDTVSTDEFVFSSMDAISSKRPVLEVEY